MGRCSIRLTATLSPADDAGQSPREIGQILVATGWSVCGCSSPAPSWLRLTMDLLTARASLAASFRVGNVIDEVFDQLPAGLLRPLHRRSRNRNPAGRQECARLCQPKAIDIGARSRRAYRFPHLHQATQPAEVPVAITRGYCNNDHCVHIIVGCCLEICQRFWGSTIRSQRGLNCSAHQAPAGFCSAAYCHRTFRGEENSAAHKYQPFVRVTRKTRARNLCFAVTGNRCLGNPTGTFRRIRPGASNGVRIARRTPPALMLTVVVNSAMGFPCLFRP